MCASELCTSVMQLINNYNNMDNYNKLKSKIITYVTRPCIFKKTALLFC